MLLFSAPIIQPYPPSRSSFAYTKKQTKCTLMIGVPSSLIVGVILGCGTQDLKAGLAGGLGVLLFFGIISGYFYLQSQHSLSALEFKVNNHEECAEVYNVKDTMTPQIENNTVVLLTPQVDAGLIGNRKVYTTQEAISTQEKEEEKRENIKEIVEQRSISPNNLSVRERLVQYTNTIEKTEDELGEQIHKVYSKLKNDIKLMKACKFCTFKNFRSRYFRFVNGTYRNLQRSKLQELKSIGGPNGEYTDYLTLFPEILSSIYTLLKYYESKFNDLEVRKLENKDARQEQKAQKDDDERRGKISDFLKAVTQGSLAGIGEQKLHELYPDEEGYKAACNQMHTLGVFVFDDKDKKTLGYVAREYNTLKNSFY